MASSFLLELDTTAPGSPAVSINSGATFTIDDDVTLGISTSDGDTTGYSMKIYGDVDDSFATSEYRASEANAPWITFNGTKSVRLSATDGSKTVRVKIRDDVNNVSSEATDSITLDTTAPQVTVTSGPTPNTISKQTGKRTSTFDWQADAAFEAYKIKVVTNASDAHTAGTQIPTTAGSTNMSGSAGGYPATTPITSTIDGADLETASAGDGNKRVKVFVQDAAGNWSINS